MGSEEIHALRGVSIVIERGEYVAIMGSSGPGKSTLMNPIGCLDTPSKVYLLNGKQVSQMNDNERPGSATRRLPSSRRSTCCRARPPAQLELLLSTRRACRRSREAREARARKWS
jgi:ABC-type uncharacterized transport system ATPase component